MFAAWALTPRQTSPVVFEQPDELRYRRVLRCSTVLESKTLKASSEIVRPAAWKKRMSLATRRSRLVRFLFRTLVASGVTRTCLKVASSGYGTKTRWTYNSG